jgi:ATP-binding cassette subfamily C (CFTR/MRP) protein 1
LQESIATKENSEAEHLQKNKSSKSKTESSLTNQINIENEMKENGEVNFQLILQYFKLGKTRYLLVPFIAFILQVLFSGYNYYFKNQQGSLTAENFEKAYFMKVTLILEIGFISFGTLSGLFCFIYGLGVSRKLNSLIIFRLMHSSLNRFFNKNPVGKVLNRFSDDLNKIDKFIPGQVSYVLVILSSLTLDMLLLLILSSPYLIVFVVVYFIIILRMQRVFTKPYKQVSSLSSTSKSPIFHLFSDSVNGLLDIRASRKESYIVKNMSRNVDFHFKTEIVNAGFIQWFQMRVTLYSLMFIIPTFILLMSFKDNFLDYSSILISVLTDNMEIILFFMHALSSFERNFVSFDRCKYYMSLPLEHDLTQIPTYFERIKNGESISAIESSEKEWILKRTHSWPNQGNITFFDMGASYNSDTNFVLKNISLEIKPGEKIGVIGRTGAGKTSFVTSLIRFFDTIEGDIKIDGQDIYDIDLKLLRRSLTFISQDSYFFEGSLRENLDPFKIADDAKLVELLKESEIYDKVELSGGLDWHMSSGGGNLSVGEKQILCFVRAIINLQKIIILDEATSNLDIKSESLLEKMKDKYFKSSTTITIAHRLNTVYQSDRILVLEKGRIKTFSNVKEFTGSDLEFFNNYIKQMIM